MILCHHNPTWKGEGYPGNQFIWQREAGKGLVWWGRWFTSQRSAPLTYEWLRSWKDSPPQDPLPCVRMINASKAQLSVHMWGWVRSVTCRGEVWVVVRWGECWRHVASSSSRASSDFQKYLDQTGLNRPIQHGPETLSLTLLTSSPEPLSFQEREMNNHEDTTGDSSSTPATDIQTHWWWPWKLRSFWAYRR